jgi:hypothetical protein
VKCETCRRAVVKTKCTRSTTLTWRCRLNHLAWATSLKY